MLLGTATLAGAGWLAVATAVVVLDRVVGPSPADEQLVLHDAYQLRLQELAAERDRRAAEASSAQGRFQLAMDQISRQQTALLESIEERRELSTALDLMRDRLEDAVGQRDRIAADKQRLLDEVSEQTAALAEGQHGADLSETLATVSDALADAVVARDTAAADREALQGKLAELEFRNLLVQSRQDEMVAELEQAVAMSFGPLEKLFAESDLDVDGLLETVRASYSGQGGPLGAATVSTRSFDDPALSSRFDDVMLNLDRMNLMRIAATKLPYGIPVTSEFRFTSGFGVRRDPKGAGRRMHAGVDFAAPRGTAIYATADGVVTSAKLESGFGNAVRIQHEFGFETLYAHQSRIRVKPGQRVSRGEQIGDMGSTGRSTGVHLHYEVHLNGTPVNPMTFLEAGNNVLQNQAQRRGASAVLAAAAAAERVRGGTPAD